MVTASQEEAATYQDITCRAIYTRAQTQIKRRKDNGITVYFYQGVPNPLSISWKHYPSMNNTHMYTLY